MVLVGQLREKCSQHSILNISHTHTHTHTHTQHKMEEVKMKEMQLYQLKKKIAENESKLKQQQVCNVLWAKSFQAGGEEMKVM